MHRWRQAIPKCRFDGLISEVIFYRPAFGKMNGYAKLRACLGKSYPRGYWCRVCGCPLAVYKGMNITRQSRKLLQLGLSPTLR